MNTILVQNPDQVAIQIDAFELLETQRNSLLLHSSMFLVQAINFDSTDSTSNTYCLAGITVFQDCLELIVITQLTYQETLLPPKDLIVIAKNNAIPNLQTLYFENQYGLNYNPIIGQEFYPDDIGFGIQKPLMMAIPPFNKYTILKQ